MTGASLGPEADLLYQAAAQPIGLLIEVEDFEALRTRLYKIKHQLADPTLNVLQFRRSPIDGGNMIITKYQVNPRAPKPQALPPLSSQEI